MRTDSQERDFVDSIRERNEGDVRRILLENANNNDMLNLLLTKKYGQFKQTALHLAVKYGDEGIVKDLLDHRADVCATDLYKRTVLHTAADENKGINIMTLILRCEGVDVNAIDGYGNTPVKLAAEGGNSEAVRLLMENGADITIADKGENTALHVAVKHGHIDVLELLLEKLAHQGIIGKQNKDKNTPLHLAVESKSQECVALLLMSGATSTMAVKNQHDQTAAELAKEHGNKGIIELLDNPQKAREFMQKKVMPPRSASMPQLGRGFSVEADSPLRSQPRQLSLQGAQELQLPANVLVNANQVFFQNHYTTNVHSGNVAVGPFSQVVQNPAAMGLPELPLASTGESHYDVQVNDGNVSVGDYSKVNVGTTSRTPSTAGSSDVQFSFPQPQENRDTSTELVTGVFASGESSGAPSENPRSLEATMESLPHPVPEESPGDKSNPALTHPVQEENLKDKTNSALTHPVQEENPKDKTNPALTHPVQEENPTEKVNTSLSCLIQEESPMEKPNASLSSPVQEQSPPNKSNSSLSGPIQEESPQGKENTSLPSPVQEESPTGKGNTSLPVQEESPTAKANSSLPYSVPEEKPDQKPDEPVTTSHAEELCTSLHSMSLQTETKGDVTPARNQSLTEETASSDTVKAAGTVSNSKPIDKSGAFNANPGGTSFKPGSALVQTWQRNIGSRCQRNARPMTRSAPKEVKDRVLKETVSSSSSEIIGLEELVTEQESQQWSGEVKLQGGMCQSGDFVTKPSTTDVMNPGSGAKDGAGLPRTRLTPGPGASMLSRAFPEEPKSAAASSNIGACSNDSSGTAACALNSSSPSARSDSSSKESPHRKERHSREAAIRDGTLPCGHGAVADGNESMRSSRNDEALRPGNHARGEHSSILRENLNSETQSSTAGNSSVIVPVPEDEDPEHDRKGHEKCDSGCYLM